MKRLILVALTVIAVLAIGPAIVAAASCDGAPWNGGTGTYDGAPWNGGTGTYDGAKFSSGTGTYDGIPWNGGVCK